MLFDRFAGSETMTGYKYKHSKLKIIGSIGFAPSILIPACLSFFIDFEWVIFVPVASVFGILIMIGLLSEY